MYQSYFSINDTKNCSNLSYASIGDLDNFEIEVITYTENPSQSCLINQNTHYKSNHVHDGKNTSIKPSIKNYKPIEDDRLIEEPDQYYMGAEEITSDLRKINKPVKHLTELGTLNIPDIVKAKADEIYQRMGAPTNRSNKRLHLIFYCSYNGYIECGIAVDPKQLAKEVGIPPNEMSKASNFRVKAVLAKKKKREEVINNYDESMTWIIDNVEQEKKNKQFTPLDFIDKYWDDTGLLDDTKNDAKEMLSGLLNKDPELNEYQAISIAIAFLVYYATISGVDLTDNFFHKVDRPLNSLNPIIKKITDIDNS